MCPRYPDFAEFTVGDTGLLKRFLDEDPRCVCEFSAANLIAWSDFDRPKYTFIENCLCICISPLDEQPFFLEPLGRLGNIGWAIEICLKNTGKISRASAECAQYAAAHGYNVVPIANHFDYLYKARDLADLKGRKFDAKRNHIRRFKQYCPRHHFIPITKEHGPEALRLFDIWCSSRRKAVSELPELAWSCQRLAVERAFEHFEELKLIGGCLIVGGTVIGFIIGSRQHNDMACIHFAHAHPDIPGSMQLLLRDACRQVFAEFEFVNLEQDLGLTGLRRSKLSYHPHRIEEKYEIEFRSLFSKAPKEKRI